MNAPISFACQAIEAISGFEIVAPATVTFQATQSIALGTGFKVGPNSVFRAMIGP